MKGKKSKGLTKIFPFRALEISLGVFILLLTLFEPLSPVFQSDVTIQREDEVLLALSDVPEKKALPEGLEIHPWLPALNSSHVKPLIREAAILLILQNVGVPLIGKFRTQLLVGIRCFVPLQRRLGGILMSRKHLMSLQKMFTSPKLIRVIERHVKLVWKFLLTAYSKTNASKIVNRCKKYLHSFLHSHHDNEHHQQEEDKQSGIETKSAKNDM